MKASFIKLSCLAGFATLACAVNLHATELTWDSDTVTSGAQDGAGNWNTNANNWWNGAANVLWNSITPDSAIFGIGTGAGATVTVPAVTTNTVGNITFNAPASGSYIIAAGNSGTSKLNLSGNPTITVTNGISATINVVMMGTTFTKAGGGTLTINPGAASIATGTTYVTGGTLVIGGAANARRLIVGDLIVTNGGTAQIGSSDVITNNATLFLYQGSTFSHVAGKSQTLTNVVLDNSTITQAGTETLTVLGNFDARSGTVSSGSGKLDVSTFTKSTAGAVTLQTKGSVKEAGLTNTIVNEGTLILDYTQSASKLADISGAVIVNGGMLVISNGSHTESFVSLTLTNGVITNAVGTTTLNPTNFMDVRKGEIYQVLGGGVGSLTKTTADTVILGANNTYSGGTLISEGILQLANGGAGGSLGTGPVTNNSVIVINRGSGTATIGGVISGTGSITNIGAGTTLLTAVNTYTGDTTILNGLISIDSDATLGDGTGKLNLSGGTLNITASRSVGTDPVANPVNVTADSSITTSSTASTVDVNFNNNSIGGTAGTLTFRNNGADAGTDQFEPRFSGTFTFNRPIVIDNGPTGKTRLSSFNTNGTTETFNSIISGNGAFRRSFGVVGTGGTTIFNATNTYSGDTFINSSTLLVNGAIGSGNVTITNGVLGGNGVVNGPVTVQGFGTLSAGASIGILTISNSLTFQDGSTNFVELNKSTPTNDLVRGITTVTYGGTLVVTNLSGTLALNDTFKIFDAATYTGSFGTTNLPSLDGSLAWDTTGLTNNGSIKVVSAVVTQPTLNMSQSGGTLTFSWADAGFKLQSQTNNLTTGLGTNWSDYPDISNPVNVTIDPANPTVFFRLSQ